MTKPTQRPWPVAVFAHNESRFITQCLDSLICQQDIQARLKIFVLANGCTDDTEEVVAEYAERNDSVRLVPVTVADKSNAWNVYIHEIGISSDIHFFIDGDIVASVGALTELHAGLCHTPYANGAAALPSAGRSVDAWRKFIAENGGMPGGLYALRGDFVDRVRNMKVKLPIGFIGDDVLLQFLIKTDLDPKNKDLDKSRIVLCENAEFLFESMSVFDPRDWRLYWKRHIRYALRTHQNRMLMPLLKDRGIEAMPIRIDELYACYMDTTTAKSRSLKGFFDRLAFKRISQSVDQTKTVHG